MNEIPAVYRLAFAVGFIFLAWYYGRREIVFENSPRETTSANRPPVVQEAPEPHPEPQPAAVSIPVEPTAESRSETKSPGKETVPEPRPVPAPPPPIRVVRVWAQDQLEIECHPNGHFLARGTIRRMPDQHWVQDGIWSNFWPKGTVSSVGEWKEGTQIGPWLFASEDGRSTVTNYPPFASAVAVAKPTPADSVAVTAPVGAAVLRQAQDSPEQSRGAASGDRPPGRSERVECLGTPTTEQMAAKKTDPNLFVCGKHDSDPYLKDADVLFLRGEWNRAKNAFSAYGDQHLNAPERAYAMLQKAVCEERMGKLPEARAGYQDFLRVFGREECGAKGQAGLAALLWKQPSSRTQALAEYEKLIKNYPTAPETAAALKVVGDYHLGQRDYAKARDCYEKFLANFPEAPGRPEVEAQAEVARLAGDCKDKTNGTGIGFDEAAKQAQDLMTLGRYKEAIILYQELSRRFGGSTESAAYCLMQIGLCYLSLEQPAQAQTRFHLVMTKYPTSPAAPEVVWFYAQTAYSLLNQPHEVERVARKLAQDYPGTFQAQQVNFIWGLEMEKRAKEQARGYWREFLKKWPDTPYAEALKERLARLTPAPPAVIRLGANP